MTDDGALVIGARCTDEECDWGPLGADGPDTWRLVEQFRREHEADTDHTTTVEVVRQRTILDGAGIDEATLALADEQSITIEWVCPECGQTADETEGMRRCPDCGEPFREALP